MKRQRGMSYFAMALLCIVIVLVVVGGLKVVPAYIEYFTILKAVRGMAESGDLRGNQTVNQVRDAFDRRAAVDSIDVITAQDLDITKEGDEIVVSFAYEKRVSLFANVSLVFDFEGASNPALVTDAADEGEAK